MQVLKTLALRGPNVWFRATALEVWLQVDGTAGHFDDALLWDWVNRHCPGCVAAEGEQSARSEAIRLERLMLALLRSAGALVSRSQTQGTSDPETYRVIVEYEDEEVGRAALTKALGMLEALAQGAVVDYEAASAELASCHQRVALGPSTRSIVQAARGRDIPMRRLTSGSMVQFGHGKCQRRIQAAETDATGAIAQEIAQDKELTRTLLRAVGVPVPEGATVRDAAEAWEVAREIGLPVVVKPRDGNQGRGVATNLNTCEEVSQAFDAALAESETGRVIVETFAEGDDYRVLVVGDQVVAAARREAAQVVGDGVHSIAELVALVNQDPRRGEDHATSLSKIPLDAVSLGVLASQGYTPDSVPAQGQRVLIRRNANLSTGGTACDVTNLVHPELAVRCVEAARMIGLDIAGVDVIAKDLGRTMEEQGAVIVEVNAAPGLRMHLEPSEGTPRPVGEAIVNLLYPPGQTSRVPIAAVTGVNGKTTVTRFLAYLVSESGLNVGMTCTDGLYVNGRRIDTGDCSGPASASAILMNPVVECAVLETARGGILRAGLGFDRCDVAIVTNIGNGDHLGLSEVHTCEQLAHVKGTIVENVAPSGAAVLNATDPLVSSMAERCPGSIIYFALDPDDALIKQHRARGGRAVSVRHGEIVLFEGQRETGLSRLVDVPITHGGRIGFQVENTLAVAAGAWALGLDLDAIRQGLETFSSETETVPGRFNLFEIHGAMVVVDYGHNTSALEAILSALLPLPCRRRLIVYTAAGDRRDDDMVEQGRIVARHFDNVFLHEDHYKRGRADGEIMALLQRGLDAGGRLKSVQQFEGALLAVEASLRSLSQGDLLLIQADTIDETMGFMHRYLAAAADGRELNTLDEIEALAHARSRKLAALEVD
jgi:cyanophycin synthetase